MTNRAVWRLTTLALTLLVVLPKMITAQESGVANAKGIEFFENKIRPVLDKYCYECHSSQSKKVRGGLSVDSKEGLLAGGDSGPALVPGRAKESLIVKAMRHEGDLQMPPRSKKLHDDIIADFVRWIDMGAADPRAGKVVPAKTIDFDKARMFWSFQPLVQATPPAVKNQDWIRTPVDRFILAKLEANNLMPNGQASRERLIRRAFFDLHGLPPTPADVEAFVNDTSPNAYEKLIDRLLESERVGERWGRHWLDLVRFAESDGYLFDGYRNGADFYRDFVIKAFNQDMPFNQFVRWQIAGDQLQPKNLLAVAATGFLVAGTMPTNDVSRTRELIRYNQLDDMIATLGTSMLGITFGCARCHTHKYDPIAQEDYYRLIACFSHTDVENITIDPNAEGYRKAKEKFDKTNTPLLMARAKFEKVDLPVRLRELAEAAKKPHPSWIVIQPVPSPSEIPEKSAKAATNKSSGAKLYEWQAHTYLNDITGIRVDAPAGKKFVPEEFKVLAAPLAETGQEILVKLRMLTGGKEPVSSILFETEAANGFAGGTVLKFSLRYEADESQNFTTSITTLPRPLKLEGTSEPQKTAELSILLAREKGQLTSRNRAGVLHWMRAGRCRDRQDL